MKNLLGLVVVAILFCSCEKMAPLTFNKDQKVALQLVGDWELVKINKDKIVPASTWWKLTYSFEKPKKGQGDFKSEGEKLDSKESFYKVINDGEDVLLWGVHEYEISSVTDDELKLIDPDGASMYFEKQ